MRARTATIVAAALTGLLIVAVLGAVWVQGWWSVPEAPLAYAGPAFIAGLVILAAFLLPLAVRPFSVTARSWLPWVIGVVAVAPTLVGYLLTVFDRLPFALLWYQGLHIPTWDWMPRFYDLTLILHTVDCSRMGFDVYVANNGCLKDAALYGPGQLWLQYIPGVNEANAGWLGLIALALSGLAVVWLARQSSGRGQLALLAAALGAGWILLVERSNLDAAIIWVAVISVILVRRWDRLWAWSVAAALIWLVGTWKYYPFVLGIMLLPVLRRRFGWTVLAGYALAAAAFLAVYWDTFTTSTRTNAGMAPIDDLVTLGRVEVVARMLASGEILSGYRWADAVVVLLVVCAAAWGCFFALSARLRVHDAMLASAGGALIVATLLISGFGYAYKSAFLLLTVPLVGRAMRTRAVAWYSSTVMLVLVAVGCIVVWNTMLATLAVLVAGGFGLGAGLTVLLRAEVDHLRVLREREVVDGAGVPGS